MSDYQESSNDKHKQTVGPLAAIFLAGLVLNLCFVLPVLLSSDFGKLSRAEKIVFGQTGKINPNVATAVELAELPSLGPAKARAIAEYRQSRAGSENAFKNSDDLEKVKGIGAKTVEKIKPWLKFDENEIND
jgi:competence ComEA-like helix-hairpin-helix protein